MRSVRFVVLGAGTADARDRGDRRAGPRRDNRSVRASTRFGNGAFTSGEKPAQMSRWLREAS